MESHLTNLSVSLWLVGFLCGLGHLDFDGLGFDCLHLLGTEWTTHISRPEMMFHFL